jgi:uncharacterized hydrophobic protein (TIGR00271 family)
MLRKFLKLINLSSQLEDYGIIHSKIERDLDFKGTNLWILVFAILVASVGLNTNSTAVIIGAMLISPLMGPINGMGYSLATFNFPMFRRALKNFGFAVGASLLASTLYFAVSPVSTIQSELLARTSPTIYDVLIALFGGLAGIVAISSTQKGNVIPGVAIATALMPPLCTAGYGLANGRYDFFFGAFYLFTINTVFIGISAVVISQMLEFPILTIVDKRQRKHVNRWITIIITITLLPSIYFGYLLVNEEKFKANAAKFVGSVTAFEGIYLLKDEINPQKKTITLVYGGNNLSNQQKNTIRDKAKDFQLAEVKLNINQGFANNRNEIIESANNEKAILQNKLNAISLTLDQREKKLDSVINKPGFGKQIMKEIKPLYPEISSVSYSETLIYKDSIGDNVNLVIFSFKKNSLSRKDKQNINTWLKARLNSLQVKTYFDEF